MYVANTPLVSVIIITYNSSKFVIETLESIKTQTWQNIELIVSDDCSTDNTVAICSDWLNENRDRFSSTKLITVEKNTGISSNCNRGLRASLGEWVKIISGDDILLNKAIEENMEYARIYPGTSFIISDVIEIDDNGNLVNDKVNNEGLNLFSGISSSRKQLKAYCRWPVFLNTPTFFYKRKLVEDIDYCDEEFRIYEDMTTIIRALENGVSLNYLKSPTVLYRIHQEATSRNPKIDEYREKEALMIFNKYRRRHLSFFNPFDLSIYYETWLSFKYKGFYGRRGDVILRKLSLFYWYMKLNRVKTY